MNDTAHMRKTPDVSIVTPAYDEEENLALLYERIRSALEGIDWEWVIIDDHSSDSTFAQILDMSEADGRVRGVRLARNSGTHISARCGLDHSRGDAVVVMASDLQDPPEAIPRLLEKWGEGAQVVWAVRAQRRGETLFKRGASRFYHWLIRKSTGIKELPAKGADFFLVDRIVVDALKGFRERHGSILMLITWLGFRQVSVEYDKQARIHGRSKWTLEKKLKLVVDSILSFSYLPIRAMSYIGIGVAVAGLVYATIVFVNAVTGNPPEGWSSLMVVVLMVGGILMLMMGVIGEYLWRALDEARARPAYVIEQTTANHEI